MFQRIVSLVYLVSIFSPSILIGLAVYYGLPPVILYLVIEKGLTPIGVGVICGGAFGFLFAAAFLWIHLTRFLYGVFFDEAEYEAELQNVEYYTKRRRSRRFWNRLSWIV